MTAIPFYVNELLRSHSPYLMKDMDRAADRIRRALADGERIAVFGDYDVDGITSTVLLMDYLKSCGAKCLRYIPRRIEDGYGLSRPAIQNLRDQGATLMITVDCGITGNEEVDFANSLGMDVVVTDHHECKEELPRAVAVVDPHRPDCPYPFKFLAGCGVALKLVLALGGESREDALFARYCTLAAIGTVADVMRMEGENRAIVSCGLEALPHTDFGGGQGLLVQLIEFENLLGVLAHRDVAVAHGQQNIAGFEQLGQLLKALDALGVALGNSQGHLVFQQVHPGVRQDEVQAFFPGLFWGVHVDGRGKGGIQFVHLLLTGRDEEVALRPRLNLSLEGAGGVEVEEQRHIGMVLFMILSDLRQRLLEGGGGKDRQLHSLVRKRAVRLGGAGSEE